MSSPESLRVSCRPGGTRPPGVSGEATARRWAWWVVPVSVLLLLSLGPFYYYPVAATAREMGPLDWLEGSVCMGLLLVAGFVCLLRRVRAAHQAIAAKPRMAEGQGAVTTTLARFLLLQRHTHSIRR